MTLLEKCLASDDLDFASPNYKHNDVCFNSAMSLFYLVCAYRDGNHDDAIVSKIKSHVVSFSRGGHEPLFDAHAFHSYVPTSCSIALMHITPTLWNILDEDVRARLDLIERAFMRLCQLYTYKSQFPVRSATGRFSWNKMRSPDNMKMPIYMLSVACFIYCNCDYNVFKRDFVTGFDYDAFVAELKQYDFSRALSTWAHTFNMTTGNVTLTDMREMCVPRTELIEYFVPNENNEPVFGGYTCGIQGYYAIYDIDEFDWALAADNRKLLSFYHDGEVRSSEIAIYLVGRIFGGGEIKNSITLKDMDGDTVIDSIGNAVVAHTQDTTQVNPVQGLDGLISEFDFQNRSDLWYCRLDFAMAHTLIAACKQVGLLVADAADWAAVLSLVKNGSKDLLFKDEVGYVGYNVWAGDYEPSIEKRCSCLFFEVAKSLCSSLIND